jgi:hypothetical protein
MALDQASIVLIAPELASVPAGVFTQVIADVRDELNVLAYSSTSRFETAARYLCAHVIALSYPDLVPGVVKSEQAGQVMRTYAVGEAKDSLDSTRYGRRYQEIRRRLPLRGALT